MERMTDVTIRDLRNQGGKIIDRVEAGEEVTITRNGRPVAELRPLRRQPLDIDTLLARWSKLPSVDPVRFRADIDELIDPSL